MSQPTMETKSKHKTKVKKPQKYAVYILNDDYTPFDFVILVLKTIFKKTEEEAVKLTELVHREGKGLCGIYSKEIAETKVNVSNEFAKSKKQPLKTILKPE